MVRSCGLSPFESQLEGRACKCRLNATHKTLPHSHVYVGIVFYFYRSPHSRLLLTKFGSTELVHEATKSTESARIVFASLCLAYLPSYYMSDDEEINKY